MPRALAEAGAPVGRAAPGGGVEGWRGLAELFLRLIDRYDEWAITLFVLVEEAGLPLPVPGDVAMLLAGYRVARGEINLPWILALLEGATLIGASVLYWLGAHGGRPLLYRYGAFLHCDRPRLDRIERPQPLCVHARKARQRAHDDQRRADHSRADTTFGARVDAQAGRYRTRRPVRLETQ